MRPGLPGRSRCTSDATFALTGECRALLLRALLRVGKRRLRGCFCAEVAGQRPHGRKLEQIGDGDLGLQFLLQIDVDGSEQKGVAAEIEKIVAEANSPRTKGLAPDSNDLLLQRR